MKQYTIYFSGQTLEGFGIDQVKQNLAKLFKLNDEKIARLFTGKTVIIKKNLSTEKTKQYQAALLKAGAKIQIKQNQEATSATPESSAANLQQVAPSNKTINPETVSAPSSNTLSTGLAGLIGYNQHAKSEAIQKPSETFSNQAASAPSLPDTNIPKSEPNQAELTQSPAISIAPPNTGGFEEFLPQVKEFEGPDLSQYSMSEANTGSLEEFAKKLIVPELPDTSYMDITDKNNRPLSDQTPKTKPVPLPKIDNLTMSEAESGDLSEFNPVYAATDLPDISNITVSQAQSGNLVNEKLKKAALPLPDISEIHLE